MAKSRDDLRAIMGELPSPQRPVSCRKIGTEDRGSFTLERLVLDINGYERVPALFMRPKIGKEPYPVVLFNHSHGNIYGVGKTELLVGRRPYMLERGLAFDLADAGIAALCIDQMCFEERIGRTESAVFKELLWDGHIMWSWMVYDSMRALDYLCSRPDIDPGRIATAGISMGSTMAQWISALDDRIKVCVDLCCMTNFDELVKQNRLDEHGIYYYVPGLRRQFGIADINTLTAPRAHLSLAGIYDPLTPVEGLQRDNEILSSVYQQHGKPDYWQQKLYPVGHLETNEMRRDVMEFLAAFL